MSNRDSYHTKQKEKILNIMKNQHHEFTIQDIYEECNKEVGLTTIYRLVDKLIEENILNKYYSKDHKTYYQYLKECKEENHFYLKCDNCKELIHIDCDCINDLSNHILKKHKFRPNKDHIIMNGICEKCIEGEKK